MVITALKRSYGKVMFLQSRVIHSVHWGVVGGHACRGGMHNREYVCGGRHGKTYVAGVYMKNASGWYASYWNAFLLNISDEHKLLPFDISVQKTWIRDIYTRFSVVLC